MEFRRRIFQRADRPGGHAVNDADRHFRTAEVAELAGVSLRQLQVWEEKSVAIASRSGRARTYSLSQALFVIVLAEIRRRGISFQRLRRLSAALRELVDDHGPIGQRPPTHQHAFILTDGRQVQLADSPNKTCELVLNFSRPIVCIDVTACLDRLEKQVLLRQSLDSCVPTGDAAKWSLTERWDAR